MASEHNPNVVGAAAQTWEKAAHRSARPSAGGHDGVMHAAPPAIIEGIERSVADRPLRALLIAFGAGVFLGKLL